MRVWMHFRCICVDGEVSYEKDISHYRQIPSVGDYVVVIERHLMVKKRLLWPDSIEVFLEPLSYVEDWEDRATATIASVEKELLDDDHEGTLNVTLRCTEMYNGVWHPREVAECLRRRHEELSANASTLPPDSSKT